MKAAGVREEERGGASDGRRMEADESGSRRLMRLSAGVHHSEAETEAP